MYQRHLSSYFRFRVGDQTPDFYIAVHSNDMPSTGQWLPSTSFRQVSKGSGK